MASQNEERFAGFNKLIYEYLVKSKFEKTAQVFEQEARIGDVLINDSPPTLLNWYSIFIETADVRSGKMYVPETLNRIEGIMLKLENDKQRYSRMGMQAHAARRTPPRHHEMFHRTHMRMPDQAYGPAHSPSPPERISREPERHLYAQPGEHRPVPSLYEDRRIDLKLPFVLLARFCVSAKILICCCADGDIYFYNLERNAIEYEFQTPWRSIKQMRVLEKENSLFLAYSHDEYNISLCRYSNGKKEDIKVITSDLPIRSMCLGGCSLFVLAENSLLRLYNLAGDLIKTFKISGDVFAIDFFGNNLLMIETSRVVEFDLNLNAEIKILSKGPRPAVCVRENFAFVLYADTIQVFGTYSPFPVLTLKCTLACKDLAMVMEKLAICTSNDVFYGHNVVPAPGAIAIAQFIEDGIARLLVITSQGVLIYFNTA